MAPKRKIASSKTRIRAHFRLLAENAVENIDQYRAHVEQGRTARHQSIEKRARNLSTEAQEFLADEIYELDTVSSLADQLAIVALYRVVELTTARMLAHEFGKSAEKKASNIDTLKQFLNQQRAIDLTTVSHYRAINELRHLNNAIKHSGKVSQQLAQYRGWKAGAELTDLGSAYDRLKPKVSPYIFGLARRLKLKYK